MARAEAEQARNINIGLPKQIIRKVITEALGHTILRTELIDVNHSLKTAEENSRRGRPTIFVFTHPTKTDPPRALEVMINHSSVSNGKIITGPIALHQDNFLYHWLGKITGLELKPIVTKNTLAKAKYKDHKLGEGNKEFLDTFIDRMKMGGTIFEAPQGERQDHLGPPENMAIRTLMKRAKDNGIEDYLIVFMGFEIKGTEDYSKKKGFNFFKKYTVRTSCLTDREILAKATELAKKASEISGKPPNPTHFLNEVATEELRKLSPDAYK